MNHPYRTSSDQQRSRGADVCTCCERPWARIAATGASASAGSQATCRDCHDHGSMAMQRDRAHIDLWRSLSRFEQRQHDAEVSRLGIQISQMEEELRDRPEKIVERYVGQDEIDEANEEAQRAFRSRENAFRALCEVRLIHREGEPGRCRCGQRLDTCKMAAIVDRYPALEKWENDQIRRLQNDLGHWLPDGHPAVLDPNWRP